MKIIKLLGAGCPSCRKAEKIIMNVISQNKIKAKLIKVSDYEKMMRYDIHSTPTVVVDEKVMIHGRIPGEQEILKLLS
jgi:small redox-active disulfide protein 2